MSESLTPESELVFICACEEWMRDVCTGEPSYQTAEGKRYCVMHFPSKNKGADFETAFRKKIEDKDFNFSGVWFPNRLSFFKFDFDRDAIFNSATFIADVDFRSANFAAQAYFNSARFSSAAHFDKANFNAEALFSAAIFSGGALFNSATFNGPAYFRATTFGGPTDFRSATFTAAAYFNATFDDVADFSRSSFREAAYFSSTTFAAAAYFRRVTFSAKSYFGNVTFSAVAIFRKATFEKEANFGRATFGGAADFRDSAFQAKADFSYSTFQAADFSSATFKSSADLRSATFSGEAGFVNCTLSGETNFSDATFRDYVKFAGDESTPVFSSTSSLNLQFVRIEKPDHLSFHTISLRPIWFVNVDASTFDFTNVKWRWRGINLEVRGMEGKKITSIHSLFSITCRQLAVNAENNHRYEEASKFRYTAMDSRRREAFDGFAFWKLSWWYWLASGYGERAAQAFLVLLSIWFLFGLIYMQIPSNGWDTKSDGGTSAIVLKSELSRALTYSAGVISLQKPEPRPVSGAAQSFVLLETILGPVQAALLALAIRRKFMS